MRTTYPGDTKVSFRLAVGTGTGTFELARALAHTDSKCASKPDETIYRTSHIVPLCHVDRGPMAMQKYFCWPRFQSTAERKNKTKNEEEIPLRCVLFGDVLVQRVCLLAPTISHRRQNRIMWTPYYLLFVSYFIFSTIYKTIERERAIRAEPCSASGTSKMKKKTSIKRQK